jgi:hypothetical protein
MSSSCHLFLVHNLSASFRVRVITIVSLTFIFDRDTLPLRADFWIAGTHCLLVTNSHDILRSAARWKRPQASGAQSFEMEIIVDPKLDNSTTRPAFFRGNGQIVFGFLPPNSFVTYDLLRKRVQAVLSQQAARDDDFWSALLLPITIGVLGITVGVAPLHCACLDRGGHGLLIAGESGAGKSTLAAALAQRGLALLSDDWTYVCREKTGLVAHGISAPIKLLPDTIKFFSELRELTPAVSLNGELAYEVDPLRVLGSTVKTASRPCWIFFLERASNPGCHFVPCRHGYTVEFFEKSAERLPDELIEAKAHRTAIIQALSACPSWILRTGENPHRTAEAIDHFLSEAQYATA